jgi:hypothetical protein
MAMSNSLLLLLLSHRRTVIVFWVLTVFRSCSANHFERRRRRKIKVQNKIRALLLIIDMGNVKLSIYQSHQWFMAVTGRMFRNELLLFVKWYFSYDSMGSISLVEQGQTENNLDPRFAEIVAP